MLKKYYIVLGILSISAVIAASYFCIFYILQYDILTQHDLVFAYGRKFLSPEHGRYIANYITNLLTEVIPEYINVHPNDLQPNLLAFIKGSCIIIQCLLLANAAFLFSKNKFKVFNPVFAVVYLLIFLMLFNSFYFFPYYGSNIDHSYFSVFENMVFFEYPMSIMLYVILLSFVTYYITNEEFPKKRNCILICLIAFFTGTSVDPVNVPTLVILAIITIQLLIKYCSKNNRADRIFYRGGGCLAAIMFCYFTGFLIYFTRPVHHHPNYNDLSFLQYTKQTFIPYLNYFYTNFLKTETLIPILSIVCLIILFIFKKHYENYKQFSFLVSVSIFTYIIFFFSIFVLGFYGDEFNFYFQMDKWISIYRVIELFNLLLIIGYMADKNINLGSKMSDIIKIILALIVLGIYHKELIVNYIPNLKNTVEISKELRISAYKIEKLAINQEFETLHVPEKYSAVKYTFPLFLNERECSFSVYVHNIHPEIKKSFDIIYDKNIDDNNILNEKELEELKFQNLLRHKMYRHHKTIINCY